ncbi:MAG: acyltransferase family protein [Cyclobacteriaceae bacterium]
MTHRRYDIDWIRVIAIGLLIVYHSAIGFQPWGMMIGFITTQKPWPSLWLPMTMLNIWRIPLLFFVSGMGVYFAMQSRSWKLLLLERSRRILVPFVFGIFCIVPIHVMIWSAYHKMPLGYVPNAGHLWFLGNIFIYTLVFTPMFYWIRRNDSGAVVTALRRWMGSPWAILLVMLALVAEVMIVQPRPYELYAMTPHGFFLGLIAFFFGFCFVLGGDAFWSLIVRRRWLLLAGAVLAFGIRSYELSVSAPVMPFQLPVESVLWILSVFAFGHRYLNKPSRVLSYLSQAAYPVYMLHMIFLYTGSALVFRLPVPLPVQYVLLLVITLAGCLGSFEIIRRVKPLRWVFGLKMR